MLGRIIGWLRMGIVDDVLSNLDDILGLRDELGAIKHHVFILTRKWSEERGKGTYTDTKEQVLPTPYVVDFSHDLRLKEAGMIKQGDILVKMISKKKYQEVQINCTVTDNKTEKYYLINNQLYEVVNVKDDYVHYDVQIRKTIKKWP